MRSVHISALALLATGVSPGFAYAQAVPAEPAPADGAQATEATQAQPATDDSQADEPRQTDDIIVTAQRRTERNTDVPISIVSQTGAQLTRAGVTSTLSLQQVVPGVVINRFGTFTAPAIRGISTRVVGAGADNNVATYVDGFYIADATSINRGFGDIEQVDVVKGPQGTLFGRNATGGAILIKTREPSEQPTFAANFGFESFGTVRGDIYASTGLAKGLSASISYAGMHSDGYYRNVAPGIPFDAAPQETHYVRGKIKWEAAPNLTFLLSAEYGFLQDAGALLQGFYAHPRNPAINSPVLTGPYEVSISHPQINGNKWHAAYLKTTLDLGFGTLTSYTGYRKNSTRTDYDLDGTPNLTVVTSNFDQRFRQRTISQELNMQNNGKGPLQWVLGFYYYNDNGSSQQLGLPNYLQLRSNTRSYAGYADVTYRIGDSLFLTGGVRYSIEDKTCARAVLQNDPITPCPTPKVTSNSFTPRGVIRYQITPNSNVYASYSRGFKSGNFNNGNPWNYVKPETVDAYEIGYKRSQGGIRFETSAFYYDYRNIQYSALCQFAPCAGILVSTNAARSEIYGGDASLNWRVSPRFNLSAGVAYTHARFKSFPNASTSVPSDLTDPNSPNITVVQNWSGQQLIRSPDWSGNIGATYTLPTPVGEFALSASGYYTSDYQPNSDSLACNTAGCGIGVDPRLRAKAYALANLNLDWTAPGGYFTLSLFVRNVFDKKYVIQTDASSFGDYRIYGEPRALGFRAGVKF